MRTDGMAEAFFQHYLPSDIKANLSLETLDLEDSSYIDEKLQETFSDLVFTCKYDEKVGKGHANIVLLVEHQSTPDKFMPFRVMHYAFNMLNKLKQSTVNLEKLPAVYAMVFYHGQQTPYPFSMEFKKCFDDPLNLMGQLFEQAIPLIDINQTKDREIEDQQALGLVTGPLKHIRDKDIGDWLFGALEHACTLEIEKAVLDTLSKLVFNYMAKTGNIIDATVFRKRIDDLPTEIRGDVMTAAEKLMELGKIQGVEKGDQDRQRSVAAKALKEGADPRFVSRITDLDLETVLKIKAEIEQE